ncbi:MAG: sigma-70 family RNA polymerase sigma factor [Oscillospiraceae bacterium]|jgi:RNA polymerase sigma-B factor|nr:sigma-70 family RNA polymerase sigma factor [Oscillospiraceae bacterium]
MAAERMEFDPVVRLAEYCETRNVHIRNELTEHYLYLARMVARRFSGRGVDYDDLLQVASIALIRALERYDCSKGVQFVTFAAPTLAGEVRNYFRDKSRALRLPRQGFERYAKIREARETLSARLGREPSIPEIALEMGIPEDDVLDSLEMRRASSSLSLDAPVPEASDDGASPLADALGTEEAGYARIESRDLLERTLAKLPETERAILEMRIIGGKSQREVARRIGSSQMQVSRIERRILDKLRSDLDDT